MGSKPLSDAIAHCAQYILRDYKAPMNRAQHLAFRRGINKTETYDGAGELSNL